MNTDKPANGMDRASFRIGGVRVDAIDFDPAVTLLLSPERPASVHLCNAYTISLASKDRRYADALNNGALNLSDGKPIVWVAKLRGVLGLTDRVCGPDLMGACLERGVAVDARHYLYGSTPEVLEALQARIERSYPGIQIVGAESPPFREVTEEELRATRKRVRDARSDLVWVGLGTPKQDYEVERLAGERGISYVAIGAAFDFISGGKKRAPTWMQRCGLEWLFRLISEPRRLWKRYLLGNLRFIKVALRGDR